MKRAVVKADQVSVRSVTERNPGIYPVFAMVIQPSGASVFIYRKDARKDQGIFGAILINSENVISY